VVGEMISTYKEEVFRHGAALGRHVPLSNLFSAALSPCLKSFSQYEETVSTYVEMSSPIRETFSMVRETSSPYQEAASSYQETSALYQEMTPNT
jgi:hypothetical protein